MKQHVGQRVVFGLSALFLALTLGIAAPVFAHADDASGSTSHEETEATITNLESTKQAKLTLGTENETESHNLAEQFKKKATSENQANRMSKQKSAVVRQKSCEARKANLTKRMANAVTHAEKHKKVFDGIYLKAKSYHDTNKLNTSDYDSLKATADAASIEADTKIAALKALNITIDCSQSNVADGVAAFKTAVGSTRDSLKTYRKSIVSLLSAMDASSKTTDDSSAGGTE